MKQVPVDGNQVLVQVSCWEEGQLLHRKIEVPSTKQANTMASESAVIPRAYIHTNIMYPDENAYSCDEEDVAHGVNPVIMQQLDMQRFGGVDTQVPVSSAIEQYYTQKVATLKRPLLRVFMRAKESDYRFDIAFRPSRAYKPKRQKRLNMQLHEYQAARQILHLENQLVLLALDGIRQREQLKLRILLDEEATAPKLGSSKELLSRLRELRQVFKEDVVDLPKETRNRVFDQCVDPECQYQFQPILLNTAVIEFMDEQFNQIKERHVQWPKHPTIIKEPNQVDQYSRMGVFLQNEQLIHTTAERTLIISDRTKKNKKKIKLMLVGNNNRCSVFDGVRASFDHFLSHYLRVQGKCEGHVEAARKEASRMRQEALRREQLLKMQQKKAEQREQLKIRLNLSQIFEEPKIVKKCIRIKWSEDTRFVLVKDESTRISLKQSNCQILLKE